MNGKESGKFVLTVLLAVLLLVNIVDAGQNQCLPDWNSDTPILIDKDTGRVEFAPGDSFPIEASYRYASSCKNYVPAVFTWQALKNNIVTNDIVFSDSHAKKTTAIVVSGAKTGERITIRGILTFADEPNGVRSEREESIFVVSKPPAPKIVPRYGPVESRQFKVNIWESEVYGSSNNFIASCSFTLKDIHGKVVDTDKKDTTFGKVMLPAQLDVKSPDIYELTVKCLDSHGSVGAVTEYLYANVTITRHNSPVIVVSPTIYCDVGDCDVKYYINSFGKSLNVTIQDMNSGTSAVRCISEQPQSCKLNFPRQGVYPVKIVASFLLGNDGNKFIYSDPSETIVQVIVSQQPQAQQVAPYQTALPAKQVQPTSTSPIYYPKSAGVVATATAEKKSPNIGAFAAIVALLILWKKIKRK